MVFTRFSVIIELCAVWHFLSFEYYLFFDKEDTHDNL